MNIQYSWLRRATREPLTHFCVIGLLLFLVDGWLNPQSSEGARKQIQVGENRIRHLASTYQTTFGRRPDRQALNALIEDFIIEEIAVREAIAIGLDRDDKIVRRRLRQKFLFTIEDMGALEPPSDMELKKWFDANQSRYQLPATISFEQALWSTDHYGTAARDLAAQSLAQTKQQTDWRPRSDSGLFSEHYSRATQTEIRHLFGTEVAQALFGATTSEWFGPVQSVYGQHLFRVTENLPNRRTDFTEIRAHALSDWMASRRAEHRVKSLAKLKQNYQIDVAWSDTILPPSAAASNNVDTPSTP